MIWTVVRIGLLRMWHGRVELALAFGVPVAFFTIFALIFGGQAGLGRSPSLEVALVDEDRTDLSAAVLSSIAAQAMIRVRAPEGDGGALLFADRERAATLVARGAVPVAIVVPAGWAAAADAAEGDDRPRIQVLSDSSDPIAPQVVVALVRQAAGQLLGERARREVEQILIASALGSGGVPAVSAVQAKALAAVRLPTSLEIDVVDLLAGDKANPVVSMYAAGIAVMFLLFTAVGAAGSLLEEEESQTLERLMCSNLDMTRLLTGKWLLIVTVCAAQTLVMFAWAQVAFSVDLAGHLAGFAVMTLATTAAAASLALVLATACRSRGQLNAVGITVILSMSALGGSMVPRYAMSDTMQDLGTVTFNAWALDGYMKVFWRDLPVLELWPEVTVLVAAAAVLFGLARFLARRWASV